MLIVGSLGALCGGDGQAAGDTLPKRGELRAVDAIVGPDTDLFAFDETGLTQQAEVVGHRRLLDRDGGLEIADADPSLVALQHVDQLKTDGV